MKWKREAPGEYTSGKWSIQGEGTNWSLFEGNKKRHKAKSKKECQQVAEEAEEEIDTEPNEPIPSPEPKAKASKLELDGVLASLRLEVDHLSSRVLTLEDSIRKLTEAVVILGKHIAKMGK